MRYLCVHCDHRFELDEEGKKPRCPKCMRKHGIEALGEAKTGEEPDRKRWVTWAAVAGVVAVVAAGYMWFQRQTPDHVEGDVPLRPLEVSELRGYARNANATLGELAELFVASDAVESLGARASSGAPIDRARSLVEAIRAHAAEQAFVPWQTNTPRQTDLMLPARVVAALTSEGDRDRLYPLEVAVTAVAALRSAGVPAMVAEAFAFPGDRQPPDPSGHFGYYLLAVYAGEPGEGDPTLLDPYGGRGTTPASGDYRVLDDLEVVGAALNHQASFQLVQEGDHGRAFTLSTSALALDPQSPSIHTVRGAVLIASGNAPEGIEEFEAAAQIRPDAPRRNNLAGIHLAQRDIDAAQREVAAALETHRDFANAHATMAAVHMARDEAELAQRELETAERLDPELFTLPMLWANYYLSTGDAERAADKAAEAVRARPHDWEVRLKAAQVYRAASRYDAMRVEARAVMEMVPADQREPMEALITQVLGDTALEEPIALEDVLGGDDGDVEDDDLGLPSGDFQLGGDSALLGGDDGPDLGTGSLLGDEALPGDGPLLNLGDPTTLRLREPGGGLRLNLDE